MSDHTKVDWANATINPLGWGCYGPTGTPENPQRCVYCYAARMTKRKLRGCDLCRQFIPHWHPEELLKPDHWLKPRRIFVCSMSDPFGVGVPPGGVDEILRCTFRNHRHTFFLLTKRPDRATEYCKTRDVSWDLCTNLWIGASITNQGEAFQRICWLWETPIERKFLSIEPIMESLYLRLEGIGFVIVGAETGPRKGKIVPERQWIADIVSQCRAQKVPVFLKRSLAKIWGEPLIQEYPEVKDK